ncbi:outer membrane beta-barrel protein [Bdellovibrio sp. 22V]|uniref:outer membrane beta-barrel protein n=1 Tax=Bdellovibrio sp. 22V TaxID=3044166 RepID=UPI002543282F|nr:outer membrane beta-barrel protein [Bdellovibrio sp. 22V]WII70594.1 outer membrane beta-barrel protein [Bdellovibrio sp. 22V]
MNVSKILASVIFLVSASASAADIAGITVNAEAAFDYNFVSSKGTPMLYTGGATNENYRLNYVQALLKKETDKLSFLTRLNYTTTSYTDAAVQKKANFGTLDQLEIFYKPAANLYIGFGRFLTTMGYESLMKYENATYTNTIAYQSIVPGYGEGLRAKYIAGDWLTATVSTYNQTTYGAFGDDYTPTKTTEASITGVFAGITWFAGYLTGTDSAVAPATGKVDKSSSSVWASYKFTDNFGLAITYDSRTFKPDGEHNHWADSTSAVLTYGLGINNLALRYEYVRGASEIGYGAGAETINSFILADKIALTENFNLYVEYRNDSADEDAFVDADGAATGSAHLVTLGALAYF